MAHDTTRACAFHSFLVFGVDRNVHGDAVAVLVERRSPGQLVAARTQRHDTTRHDTTHTAHDTTRHDTQLTWHTTHDTTRATAQCRVRYRTDLLQKMWTVFWSVPLVLGLMEEKQALRLELLSNHIDTHVRTRHDTRHSPIAHATRHDTRQSHTPHDTTLADRTRHTTHDTRGCGDDVTWRGVAWRAQAAPFGYATVALSHRELEVYSAELHIEARLSGIRSAPLRRTTRTTRTTTLAKSHTTHATRHTTRHDTTHDGHDKFASSSKTSTARIEESKYQHDELVAKDALVQLVRERVRDVGVQLQQGTHTEGNVSAADTRRVE